MNEKYCPLSAGSQEKIKECFGKDCGFWVEERDRSCAITVIAKRVESLGFLEEVVTSLKRLTYSIK